MKRTAIAFIICLLLMAGGIVSAQSGSGKGGGTNPTPTPVAPEPTPVESDPTEVIDFAEPEREAVIDLLQQGSESVEVGDLLRYEPFDEDDSWELWEGSGGYLRIDEGRYHIFATEADGYLWGQDTQVYTNTIIQVETEQLSAEPNNGYGVMCRGDVENTSNGYHLWISGDGYVSIILITDEDIFYLVEWELNGAINMGQASNEITAVCSGNYFALYVNGDLAAETTDDTYSEGVTGFSAVAFEEGSFVEIAYDEARIWQVGTTSAEGTSIGGLIGSSGDGDEEATPSGSDSDGGGLGGIFGSTGGSDEEATPSGSDSDGGLGGMLGGGSDGDAEEARLVLEDTLSQSGDLTLGDLLRYEPFDSDDAWELYEGPDGGGWLRVIDGQYRIFNQEGGILWGQDTEEFTDVVIEVDATFLAEDDANAYGIMCRADPANTLDGYHFFISADGYYAIYVSVGGDLEPLVSFERAGAINTGQASNHITAVCVDNYLALYINGDLVEEYTDSTYSSGVVGLTTGQFEDTGAVEVAFDDVRVWDVSR